MNTAILIKLYSDKRAFVTLAVMCIALFVVYVYLISASIVHVVIRTEIDQDITQISSEISTLETKYIEAQHKLSSDIASLQGYKQTADKIFIDKTADSLVLRTSVNR
jgi:hypothetical protein